MKKYLLIPAFALAATTFFAGCGGGSGDEGGASAEDLAALNATAKAALTSLETQDFSVFTLKKESDDETTTEDNHSTIKTEYYLSFNKDIGYLHQRTAADGAVLEVWLYIEGSDIIWAKAQQEADSIEWDKTYVVLSCSSQESAVSQFPDYATTIMDVSSVEEIERIAYEYQAGLVNYVEAWSAESGDMQFTVNSVESNAFDIVMKRDTKRDDTAVGGNKEEVTSTQNCVMKGFVVTKSEGSNRHYTWEQWGNEEWQFAWMETKSQYKEEFSLTCASEKPDLEEFTRQYR